MKNQKDQLSYRLMLAPAIITLLIFSYAPMVGIVIAFQDFVPAKGIFGSRWVGLDNFKFMFALPDVTQVLVNTIIISFFKIILGILIPVCFALLLNEIRLKFFKKVVQTIVYLPHFLSWVVLAAVVQYVFGYDGPINNFAVSMGRAPTLFMASNTWFRPICIFTDTWKEFGYGSIIYLAALTSIDPGLYEASAIDGANRWKQLLHVTLPGIVPTIVLMVTMSLPNILNANFDQIYNLYNPLVYQTGDIIDTYVYRIGMVQREYSLATGVGLIKSVVGMVLMVAANQLTIKLTDRKMF
ncbi:protein lplB [Clostridium sp. W14A]|uniref:Sugar ABC transporter permease n=1 Tax=Caproicibacter fermentans TaxID=2576756 RepID=A0A7G8T7C5_9FIRM|nr:ABC transporter permease subunit [Caproicibacter fermentans]OCN01391.1 protein lplB [Clostridium sp. W14A]QNK39516.1 sugar ABC transporter permease [Caproicibacter fermentans]